MHLNLRVDLVLMTCHWLSSLPAPLVTLTLYSYTVKGDNAADSSTKARFDVGRTFPAVKMVFDPLNRLSMTYSFIMPFGKLGGDHLTSTEVGVKVTRPGGDMPSGSENKQEAVKL